MADRHNATGLGVRGDDDEETRTRFLLVLGGEDARVEAARRHLAGHPFREIRTAADWPFQREVVPAGPDAPVLWLRDLHHAFPAGQSAGTRLVLTQSTYQLQRWVEWLERTPGRTVVADADRSALRQSSPEAFAGRGPWQRIAVVDIDEDATPSDPGIRSRATPHREADDPDRTPRTAPHHALHRAFTNRDPHQRLDACRLAVDAEPDNPAVQLAFASTCMELQLLDDAETALERAVALAPEWEAVHFERGKLLLRREETERAAAAFAEAARLMPTFAAALLNLGAALGELGRRDEATSVLRRAVEADPRSHTALNNLGAVCRDAGRLDEAVSAFRGVLALAPAFVFGYYNLGQTLLLQGDAEAARRAYEEGFARDPQKNPRQACRLAVARAAAGDARGASEIVHMLVETLPRERALDLLAEAESTLGALSPRPGADGDAVAQLRDLIRSYSS